jgi:6-phosphogluconolactonase
MVRTSARVALSALFCSAAAGVAWGASISSYTVGNNGTVTLLNAIAASGSGPNDLAAAVEGHTSFLYTVDAGTGTVGAFRINGNGSLTAITGASGLPAGRSAQGLAAF